MNDHGNWLIDLGSGTSRPAVDGVVLVDGYNQDDLLPEEIVVMEKAKAFEAHAVFFEEAKNGRAQVAQAFIYISDGPANDAKFAEIHQRLWSWGGVPLVYRKVPGLIQLFRCAHKPDFLINGEIVCNPFDELNTVIKIAQTPKWWDSSLLRNGALWDDSEVCKEILSVKESAHRSIFSAIMRLNNELNKMLILPEPLRRRLLILSLLTSYLEERKALPDNYFNEFVQGAETFFQVLKNGPALVKLLKALENKFNGHVFKFSKADLHTLKTNSEDLEQYAHFIEARTEPSGQRTLWNLYSFKDLPVELISNIYQIFVADKSSSIYTPPFLVRLILEEALSWDTIDKLHEKHEVILDPACGSGVFLVEAFKRLVLHWRIRNEWDRPDKDVLKSLIQMVHGIDLEKGAVELSAFSLCLALCDALEPEDIRSSIGLFPLLKGKSLHHSCFFKAKHEGLLQAKVGVVVGNPPFKSKLTTKWAKKSYYRYNEEHETLPDTQLAYLFLHEAMNLLSEDGVLCMLQNYNFLYNSGSQKFRQTFFSNWNVREVLDLVSVRGLFSADTKVVVIVANASKPSLDKKVLHATFRRSGRVSAELGFDIDYYDLHWIPYNLVLENDSVWRANLLGGERVLQLTDYLKSFRTLRDYAESKSWDFGEGFIIGEKGNRNKAKHITGKKFLPSRAMTANGIDRNLITVCDTELFHTAYTEKRFSPPLLLIKENMDLHHDISKDDYLTYKARFVGFSALPNQKMIIQKLDNWLKKTKRPLQAFIAATSPGAFIQKSTAIASQEILNLPYPENGHLELSINDQIIVDDILDYYRDLIRLGQNSKVMRESGWEALPSFTGVYKRQINSIYKDKPLRTLRPQMWPGVICQPFVFGDGEIDWSGVEELQEKLNGLLIEKATTSLNITRIARIYDGNFVFLLKSDRLRYWLRSVALRDADDTLADLQAQGF